MSEDRIASYDQELREMFGEPLRDLLDRLLLQVGELNGRLDRIYEEWQELRETIIDYET